MIKDPPSARQRAAERRARVRELKAQGLTNTQISQRLGMDLKSVAEALKGAP